MRRASLAVLAWAALAPLASSAQQAATLDDVDALVNSGRTEEARVALLKWWEGATASRGAAERTEQQRGLWLRGVLTVDPTQAALDYQRLVVEYPGGPWSDQAFLRLAMIADARGDQARARDQLRALLRDYPGSSLRSAAERLLAAVDGAAPPAPAPAAAQAVIGGPSALPAVVAPAPAPEPVPVGVWTVQVGAFASPDRARSLRDQLAGAGLDARLVMVPGSPLLRVRTGRFTVEDQAQALRRGLLARGFDATVSADADREEAAP